MFDISVTEDGDFVFDMDHNDLVETKTLDVLRAQLAHCRIKSVKSDWYFDHVGADLEELIGMPNTKETRELGKSKIVESLTYDTLFNPDEIYIVTKIENSMCIEYDVYLQDKGGQSSTLIVVRLDLIKGVNILIGE